MKVCFEVIFLAGTFLVLCIGILLLSRCSASIDVPQDAVLIDSALRIAREAGVVVELRDDASTEPSHACPPWCKVGNQPPNRIQDTSACYGGSSCESHSDCPELYRCVAGCCLRYEP